MIKIHKGLDLPIQGQPEQKLGGEKKAVSVAVLGRDYVAMKPTMSVKEGDSVKRGQALFTDKGNPRIRYTSPAAGTVSAIHRGQKRILLAVVIDVKGNEAVSFKKFSESEISSLSREVVTENLLESGLWTSLRTRPYSRTADPDKTPHSIFVNAMDTEPLAPNPEVVIKERQRDFLCGLQVIKPLTDGKVYLAHHASTSLPLEKMRFVESYAFDGPHPAGLPGTHIHFLDPVNTKKTVWHLGYQDVIAIGHQFLTGELDTSRVISLAGPGVKNPRLLTVPMGANLSEVVEGELKSGSFRTISGSVLNGRAANPQENYLGRYHRQVSVIDDGGPREFLGWQAPGFDKFSVKNIFMAKLLGAKKFAFDSRVHGSPRSMVPIGSFEKVMPLDMMPTFLLRSLLVGDTETAQALGCLELDEEDLSLCTFVCPGKTDYGPILRKNLERIQKEG